jgi:hypothetical protein
LNCPFCAQENAPHAVVCCSCARDIVVPPSLIAERDDLIHKREGVRGELLKAKLELDAARRAKKPRSV